DAWPTRATQPLMWPRACCFCLYGIVPLAWTVYALSVRETPIEEFFRALVWPEVDDPVRAMTPYEWALGVASSWSAPSPWRAAEPREGERSCSPSALWRHRFARRSACSIRPTARNTTTWTTHHGCSRPGWPRCSAVSWSWFR